MSFSLSVGGFKDLTERKAVELRRVVQMELVGSIIMDTPVDTGLARMNWIASKGYPANYSMTLATAPKNPVAEAMSQAFGEDGVLYFVNNVSYVPYLEYGHSKQAPHGMARRNVRRVKRLIERGYFGKST